MKLAITVEPGVQPDWVTVEVRDDCGVFLLKGGDTPDAAIEMLRGFFRAVATLKEAHADH